MKTTHFIDVGANTGQAFEYLAQFPEYDGCVVWLLEPSPRYMEQLLAKAREFSSRYRVHVCPFGLSDSTCVKLLNFNALTEDSFERHVLPTLLPFVHTFVQDAVEFVLSISEPYDRVVLKLDCEGSEYAILSRMLTSPDMVRVQKILVEFHPVDSYSDKLRAILEAKYAGIARPLEPWNL